MSHSHLPIRHLLRQVEKHAGRRQPALKVPDWLTEFVQQAADLFEPFQGVARPGYECVHGEDRWEIGLFLGRTEVVGGPLDGDQLPVNFRFDLAGLAKLFEPLEVLRWNAFPDCHDCSDDALDLSCIIAEGRVNGVHVSLQVHSGPPEAAGPALKRYADGSYTTC